MLKAPCQNLFTHHTRLPGWNLWAAGPRQRCSLTDSLMNSPGANCTTRMDRGKEGLVLSVLGASSYGMHLSLKRAKVRRLVQYSQVSRTYLNHVTFLLILPVFSEFCVLYVQCGFQSTFGTLYKLRKALARRTRPLLYLREKETAIWE